MNCDQCGLAMVNVGRQIQPGNPRVYVDAWVCPKARCPGYGTTDDRGGASRWPAMTLMPEAPIHAAIRGAMKFRDRS